MRASEGSIDKLGPNHYRVRVHLGYDGATGKPIRLSKTIRGTLSDAKATQDKLMRSGGGSAAAFGKMSVYEFVKDEWLATRKLRETTLEGYNSTLENHIRRLFSTVKVKDLTPLYIRRALGQIEHAGAALNVYKMLRSALNLAADSYIIERNPIRGVEAPETQDYEADVYELEEVLDVLEYVRGKDIEPGIIIAATCGTRASETCALDWQDLELERLINTDGEIVYRGSADVHEGYHRLPGKRITTPTKTKRSNRVVALPGFAVKRLLEIRGDGRIGPLMIDTTGQRMAPEGLTARWRKMMLPRKNSKGVIIYEPPMRYIPLKNLRHSQSTILLDLGATMHEVSRRDGHSNERTTDTFYNKPKMRRADHSVAEKFDLGVASVREKGSAKARAVK